MTRIGIIENGRQPDAITQRYGDYPQMFRDYFAEQKDLSFTTYSAQEQLPDIKEQDAWLLTGSPAGVYENHAWIAPLQTFIRTTIGAGIPTIGICFGHQLIASAFGGTVVKSEKGRGIGVQGYPLTPAGRMFFGQDTLHLVAMHQDQVVTKPKDADVLASSPFCEFAALRYGTSGVTMQPHLEFTIPAGRDISRLWQQKDPVSDTVMQKAEDSFKTTPSDGAAVAPVLARFLSGAMA